MSKLIQFHYILSLISFALANYNGPFLLWGRDELKNIDVSALQSLDDGILQNIYSEAAAIILFVRNTSNRLNEDNFPTFRRLVHSNSYIYLTQYSLSSNPVDFNINAEVINLVGPDSQQDIELSALYNDALLTYGEGKVLGILATKSSDHRMQKRQAVPTESIGGGGGEKEVTADANKPDESKDISPIDDDEFYTYIDSGKAILYTKALKITDEENGNLTLGPFITVNGDYRVKDKLYSLHITYKYNDPRSNSSKLSVIFRFPFVNGYWFLNSAEIRDQTRTLHVLNVVGNEPSAPSGFSYKCSRALVFRNSATTLTLRNVQVQAEMSLNLTRFGAAYDCVGFTTAPIWSGLFVAFIICFVTALSIHCILEIKPPNRFENSRSKQLIFTVQE